MRLRVFILMGLTILLVGLSYVVLRALNMQMVNIAPAKLINIVHSNTADDETNVEQVPSASPISPSKSPTEQQGRNDNEHQVDQPVDGVSKSEVNGDVIVDPVPDVIESSQPKVELPTGSSNGVESKQKQQPPPKPIRGSSLNVNIDAAAKPVKVLSPVVENVQSQPEVELPTDSQSGVLPKQKQQPPHKPHKPIQDPSLPSPNAAAAEIAKILSLQVQSQPKVELPSKSPSDVVPKQKKQPPPTPIRGSSLNVNIDAAAKPVKVLSPVVDNVQSQPEVELPTDSQSGVLPKQKKQPPPKPIRGSSLNVNIDAAAKPVKLQSPVVDNVQSQRKVELPTESRSGVVAKQKQQKPIQEPSLPLPSSPNSDAWNPVKILGIQKTNSEDAIIKELNAKLTGRLK